METESPWIETTSKYKLQENMTYQIDTFFTGNGYGLRWETGVIVKKGGCEIISMLRMRLALMNIWSVSDSGRMIRHDAP